MNHQIKIGARNVGSNHPPFVIAEMSGNHNQSLERALAIVEAAATAGAHALKLQTYTAETMTLDLDEGDFRINDSLSLWTGRSLFDLYRQAHTPWEWHEPIFRRARELGMECFSTPFDASALEFLESLDVPCYKIASFENTDLPLIRKVASTGKPIIVSTGMATAEELAETVATIRATGNDKLVLLKCTSTYPADPASSHIRTLPHLRETFGCEVGLSDHTMGVGVAVAAVALGATVVEKHFTLDRAEGGVDSAFSLEPEELAALVTETYRAWQSLGEICYGPTHGEIASLKFRRSIYITRDLAPGDILGEDNLRCIRPGGGLAPKYFDQLLGRKVAMAVKKGTPASWDLLDGHCGS
jgi:pseudaminic acid synthase